MMDASKYKIGYFPASAEYNRWVEQDHIENILAIFYSKEVYSFWVDTPYRVHFDYGGVRYSGHTTVEDCLLALKKNLISGQFPHLSVFGDVKKYISPF